MSEYQLPMIATAMMPASDRVAIDIERARQTTGLVARLAHEYREGNRKKALSATHSRLNQEYSTLKSATAVVGACAEFQVALMQSSVSSELSGTHRQVMREEMLLAFQGRLSHAEQMLLSQRRETLNATHSLEATQANKYINYALGRARKEASLAETAELMPDAAKPKATGNTITFADALQLRRDLKESGLETQALDDKINELAARADFDISLG